MKSNLFGNPHSSSPSSHLSTTRVDTCRASVLKYFNADAEDYDVVFTQNATAAIKLVAQCFQDRAGSFWHGYHKDAHTSLVGVREIASIGSKCFDSDQDVEEWIENGETNWKTSNKYEEDASKPMPLRLFAYPAQSNMTGHRSPLNWASRIRKSFQNTYTLLDAASYLTTGRLDLSDPSVCSPDFIALSFYKIFGFPDLGALLVRKDSAHVLCQRRYFGGGTVDMVVVDEAWHALHNTSGGKFHEVLEDGTLPFHNILALQHGTEVQRRLFGSAKEIMQHAGGLANWLYHELIAMRHWNGKKMVQVYLDPYSTFGDSKTQGPIISFNILDAQGRWVGKSQIEGLAIACGIQLRTGGVCNPGGAATLLDLKPWEFRRNFAEGMRCGDAVDILGGKPTGIVRVSLGAMSTAVDVKTMADFVKHFFIEYRPRGALWDEHMQTQVTKREIVPVEGCGTFLLPKSISSKTAPLKEVYAAFSAWEHRWCIVDRSNGSPIRDQHNSLDLSLLDVSIYPGEGVLRIRVRDETHRGTDERAFDEASPGIVPPTTERIDDALTIDLWKSPPTVRKTTSKSAKRMHDPYTETYIAEWLTRALGVSCTLARYRHHSKTPAGEKAAEKRQCVVARCQKEFANPKDLKKHYELHQKEFAGALLKKEAPGGPEKGEKQYFHTDFLKVSQVRVRPILIEQGKSSSSDGVYAWDARLMEGKGCERRKTRWIQRLTFKS